MLKNDYKKLYQLQDNVLDCIFNLKLPFYLTGGTALGRFYLNHRISEDLDFFVNNDSNFTNYIKNIHKTFNKEFQIDTKNSLFGDEFARFIIKKEIELKIEFVNDVSYRFSEPIKYSFGLVDNVRNILSNKICAVLSRDETKDVFDIVYISRNYYFNWYDLFIDAKKKSIVNEIELSKRIKEFPIKWLDKINWTITKIDINNFKSDLERISNDIFLAQDNSLCKKGINLIDAKPVMDF